MQETWVQSLGREDLLEEGMAIHPSILAWRVPWTEEPGGLYSPQGCKQSDKTEVTEYTSILSIVSGFFGQHYVHNTYLYCWI